MDNPESQQPAGALRPQAARLLYALRFPDFRVLWVSTFSNQLGQGMQQVVLGWLVLEMTGSGTMVGAVFAARSAPNLVVGFLAGSITDRLDRRLLVRVSVCGLTLVAGMVGLLAVTERLTVWHLMLATVALGTLQAFYMTARQAYVYDIVGLRGALNGIALISMAQRLGGIAGALASGSLIQQWGPGPAFLGMGAGYALGFVPLFWLRRAGQAAPTIKEALGQNLLNYFRAMKSNRVMFSLMVTTAAAEAFGFSHQVVLPILAKDVLHVGAAGLGLLTAFRFIGGALGVFAGAAMGQANRPGVLLLLVLAGFGGSVVLLGQSPVMWAALVSITLINVMASVTDLLHHTLLQANVPNEQRGRAMGVWVVGVGTGPFGQLEIGYLAGLTDSRIALLANGAALAAGALAMGIFLPRLRRL